MKKDRNTNINISKNILPVILLSFSYIYIEICLIIDINNCDIEIKTFILKIDIIEIKRISAILSDFLFFLKIEKVRASTTIIAENTDIKIDITKSILLFILSTFQY